LRPEKIIKNPSSSHLMIHLSKATTGYKATTATASTTHYRKNFTTRNHKTQLDHSTALPALPHAAAACHSCQKELNG